MEFAISPREPVPPALSERSGSPQSEFPSASIPPREVVRCQSCHLVQFRTACDLCRRCKRALPSQIPLIVHTVEAAPVQSNGTGVAAAAHAEGRLTGETDSHQPLPLGRTVEQLRKAHGCSQEELARLVGIRRTYLSRVENGHVMPGPRIVSKIAQALGIEMQELLVREPSKRGALRIEPNSARLVKMFSEMQPREMAAIIATARQMLGEQLRRSA